jgi:hypothetical protein
LFESVERGALKPLPTEPYELGRWSVAAAVNIDYHVAVERNFHSVPHELVRKRGRRVHHGDGGATVPPRRAGRQLCPAVRAEITGPPWPCRPAHSAVANRTPEWVRGQAARVGVGTAAYVERLPTGREHIQQGVRSCMGILRLATRHAPAELEAACLRALSCRP